MNRIFILYILENKKYSFAFYEERQLDIFGWI